MRFVSYVKLFQCQESFCMNLQKHLLFWEVLRRQSDKSCFTNINVSLTACFSVRLQPSAGIWVPRQLRALWGTSASSLEPVSALTLVTLVLFETLNCWFLIVCVAASAIIFQSRLFTFKDRVNFCCRFIGGSQTSEDAAFVSYDPKLPFSSRYQGNKAK